MKTILCYGDSNTFGYNPKTGNRFNPCERWPGVLKEHLGPGYQIIEEGLNHRTTIWDDPALSHVNGRTYLLPCLNSHRPIDLVILMLGSNDMKHRMNLNASDIAEGIGILADMILKSGSGPKGISPEILILSPPRFGHLTRYAEMFESHEEKQEKLGSYYGHVASDYGCHYVDVSSRIQCPDTDGLHLEEEGHEALGTFLAPVVREIFSKPD